MNRSGLIKLRAKRAKPDKIVSQMIDFLHKSVHELYSDETIKMHQIVFKNTKTVSEMIDFLHKSLLEHDLDESISFRQIMYKTAKIQTKNINMINFLHESPLDQPRGAPGKHGSRDQ